MTIKFRCKECGEEIIVDETENYGTDESLCPECLLYEQICGGCGETGSRARLWPSYL
jgi:hypothetical protein